MRKDSRDSRLHQIYRVNIQPNKVGAVSDYTHLITSRDKSTNRSVAIHS